MYGTYQGSVKVFIAHGYYLPIYLDRSTGSSYLQVLKLEAEIKFWCISGSERIDLALQMLDLSVQSPPQPILCKHYPSLFLNSC